MTDTAGLAELESADHSESPTRQQGEHDGQMVQAEQGRKRKHPEMDPAVAIAVKSVPRASRHMQSTDAAGVQERSGTCSPSRTHAHALSESIPVRPFTYDAANLRWAAALNLLNRSCAELFLSNSLSRRRPQGVPGSFQTPACLLCGPWSALLMNLCTRGLAVGSWVTAVCFARGRIGTLMERRRASRQVLVERCTRTAYMFSSSLAYR